MKLIKDFFNGFFPRKISIEEQQREEWEEALTQEINEKLLLANTWATDRHGRETPESFVARMDARKIMDEDIRELRKSHGTYDAKDDIVESDKARKEYKRCKAEIAEKKAEISSAITGVFVHLEKKDKKEIQDIYTDISTAYGAAAH